MASYFELKNKLQGGQTNGSTGKSSSSYFELKKRVSPVIEANVAILTAENERKKKEEQIRKSQEEAQRYQSEAGTGALIGNTLKGINPFSIQGLKNIGQGVANFGSAIINPIDTAKKIGGAVKNLATSSAQETAYDVFYQKGLDEQNLKTIQENNKKVLDLNEAIKNTQDEAEKEKLKRHAKIYLEFNQRLAEETGGELKDKTNLQLAGKALGTAMDLTPFLGFGSLGTKAGLKTLEKVGVKSAGKVLGRTLPKTGKELTKEAIIEGGLYGGLSGFGAGIEQKDPTIKSVGLSTAIGTGLGAGGGGVLSTIFSRLGSKAPRLKKAIDEGKIDESEIEKIFEEDGIAGVEEVIKPEPRKLKAGEFAPISKEIQETTGKKLTAKETLEVKDKIEQGYTKEEIIDEIINPRRTEPTPKSIKTTPKRTKMTSKPVKVESKVQVPKESVENNFEYKVAKLKDKVETLNRKMTGDTSVSESFPMGKVGFQGKSLSGKRGVQLEKTIDNARELKTAQDELDNLLSQKKAYDRIMMEKPTLEKMISSGKYIGDDLQGLKDKLRSGNKFISKFERTHNIARVPRVQGATEVSSKAPLAKSPSPIHTGKAKKGERTYKILKEEGITDVQGTPVKIVDGVDTFVHKGTGGWVVSESSTGRYIADSGSINTKESAIKNAKLKIKEVGEDKFKKLLSKNKLPQPEVDDIAEYVKNKSTKFRVADEGDDLAKKMKSEGKSFDEFVKAQGKRTGIEVRDKIGTKLQDPYTAEYLPTNADGTITLYHSTTKESAEKIKQSGLLGSKTEGGDIYFTTNKNGYGGIGKDKDVVLTFNVDPKKVKFDDIYRGELHLKGNNVDIGGIKPVELKTKSQLIDIWNKANQATPEQSLIQEAKKYKSAEDFVKAQGTPVYRGEYTRKQTVSDSVSTSLDRRVAESFAEKGNVSEMIVDKNAKIVDLSDLRKEILGVNKLPDPSTLTKEQFEAITGNKLINYAKSKGYDVIDKSKAGIKSSGIKAGDVLDEQEFQVLNKDVLKTKSQLLDIWNKEQEKFRVKDDLAKVGIKELISGKATKKVTPKIESKKGESITAKKLNEVMPDEYKINEDYDKITLKGELDRASKEIAKNKDEALRKAFSRDERVDRRIAKLEEFAQIAKDNKDYEAVNRLFTQANKIGTETAQGLNMLKALYAVNPEYKYMQEIINARLAKVKFGVKDIEKATKEVREIISRKGKDLKEKTKQAFKVKDAQELLNSIMCK